MLPAPICPLHDLMFLSAAPGVPGEDGLTWSWRAGAGGAVAHVGACWGCPPREAPGISARERGSAGDWAGEVRRGFPGCLGARALRGCCSGRFVYN